MILMMMMMMMIRRRWWWWWFSYYDEHYDDFTNTTDARNRLRITGMMRRLQAPVVCDHTDHEVTVPCTENVGAKFSYTIYDTEKTLTSQSDLEPSATEG